MAGDLKVSNGSTYVPTKGVSVSNGSSYVAAKGVYVSRGDGTWTSAWPNLSTVTVSAPSYAMSNAAGTYAPATANTIVSPTFTVTLSNPTAVASVALQLSYSGGTWTQYKLWTSGITSVLTHAIPFSTPGAWQARAVITHSNGTQVTSNSASLTCYLKSLYIKANDSFGPIYPDVGSTVTFTPGCADDCAPGQLTNTWWYTTNGSPWTYYGSSFPSQTWPNIAGNSHWWMYRETFTDGSIIHSPYVTVVPTVPVVTHFHEFVPSGSSRKAIQDAMDRAYWWWIANKNTTVNFNDEQSFACVQLATGGVYQLDGALKTRRGVRVYSAGTGASRAEIRSAFDTHAVNVDNNGGGGYDSPHYDWQFEGIIFNGMNQGKGFSIVHTRRFRVYNCRFHNAGGLQHYIEINSSGGARSDGTYNCLVENCEFTMSNTAPLNNQPVGRRTEDECIQLDYSWPKAAANVASDGTVTNNVYINACWFHHAPRAIGGHHYQNESGTEADPKGIHSNILIQNNTFQNIDPNTYGKGASGRGYEGAVRAYVWSNVNILSNTFESCYQSLAFSIPADCWSGSGYPTYARVYNNAISNQTSGRPGIVVWSNSPSIPNWRQFLAENNRCENTWGGSDFFIDPQHVGTSALPGSTYGVVVRANTFRPTNLSLATEKAYNKYSRNNDTGVTVYNNYVSDGSVDNS